MRTKADEQKRTPKPPNPELDAFKGRSLHDRVALDNGIDTGEVCPESAG
jgi:hypothetical protein